MMTRNLDAPPNGDAMNAITTACTNEDLATLEESERQPCEVWTRVMGYHRPVSSFNIGKQGEFHERTFFTERAASAQTE
jgi:anaerobic ribonucleoside-triphosphate reductase